MNFFHNIKSAMLRELRLMRQRPVYLQATIRVMAFCTGILPDIPEGRDAGRPACRSGGSGQFVPFAEHHQTDRRHTAGQDIEIRILPERKGSLADREINAFCVFPDRMYEDVISGRRNRRSHFM